MYFKAYISITTEQYELNPETGAYDGGIDPDSFTDHGVVDEFTDATLEGLVAKIENSYFSLTKPIGADVQIFDGAIEIQYSGEHDYRTPKAEQIPFVETARVTISKVDETYLDLASEPLFKNLNK